MKNIEARNPGSKHLKFHFDNCYFDNPQFYESIILYQIGDISCEGGYTIGDHSQNCYEISYIASGNGYYYTDNKEYKVSKGDIFLNRPGELHNGKADMIDPFRYFYIGFGFDATGLETNHILHIRKTLDQAMVPVTKDKFDIHIPFMSIFNELVNINEYSGVMIKTFLYQIVILAYRSFFSSWDKNYSPSGNSDKTSQTIYEIINYIDLNLCRIKDLTDISNQLGYSYPHLSRIFSGGTGLSIQEYYNKKRFEKAVDWLKSAEYSITAIAENLQYQSIHSFSKAFRKYFGISPTEYQELFKKGAVTDE